jgi:hypothetical protein
MKNLKIISILLIIILIAACRPHTASAQVTLPHPFVDFSGLLSDFDPSCLNGALTVVLAPEPLILLMPYVPITPIVPVMKLWGPVTDASTLGNYLIGGVCLTSTTLGIVEVPVTGTLVQIGTTAAPTPWFVPLSLI